MAACVGKVLSDIAGRELPIVDSMVKIQEVIDGDWSAGGNVLRLQDIVAYIRTP